MRFRHTFPFPASGAVIGSLVSAGFAQVALVGTGVLTARVLGPADRGHLALVILVPTVLAGIGTLGLPRAITYFIASDPSDEASVRRASRLPALIQAAILTTFQAALLMVILPDDPRQVRWAGVVVLPLLAGNLAEIYGKAILQGQRRYAPFNLLRNAALFFYLAGLVVLIAAGQAGVVEFAIAYVVANVVSGVVTLSVALARIPPPPTESDVPLGTLMRFGIRGYLAWLSPIGTFRLDQLLIGVFLAPEALGLYVVGLSFTNLPTFISRSIGFIAYPHVAGATEARADEMRHFVWLSIALSGTAVLVLEITAGWLVPFFFGTEFRDAVPLTQILLLGAFFVGARQILTETSSGGGRPGLGSISELTSWLVLVPAVAVLMPAWGTIGVATATTISSVTSFVALLLLVRHSGSSSWLRAKGRSTTK